MAVYVELPLSGCSAIGYAIGKKVDGGTPGEAILIPEELSEIPWDVELILVKNDGSTVQGAFRGVTPWPETILPTGYAEEFESWRLRTRSHSAWVPPLGSTIQINMCTAAGADLYRGPFAGFDRDIIRISSGPSGKIVPLKAEFVQNVRDSLGRIIGTQDAVLWAIKEGAPLASRDELELSIILDGQSKAAVPLDRITSAYYLERGPGRWVGFAIGIVVDVAVLIAIMDNPNGPGFFY